LKLRKKNHDQDCLHVAKEHSPNGYVQTHFVQLRFYTY